MVRLNEGSTYQRGGYGRYPGSRAPDMPSDKPRPPPLGKEIATRNPTDIETDPSVRAEISDCRFVASYNLLDGLQQTILVPGEPPKWTPLSEPAAVRPDHGFHYTDPNKARFPQHSLEPAVTSIFLTEPSFDPTAIDIFACGSTLGDILRFCNGVPVPFSFIVQNIGSSIFFLRRLHDPAEGISHTHRTYGYSFPATYTTWSPETRNSSSNQRIIAYTFGGLRLLVRYEVDTYKPEPVKDGAEDVFEAADSTERVKEASEQPPAKIKPSVTSKDKTDQPGLVVQAAGRVIPQEALSEIKTRAGWKEPGDILEQQLPRLWIRQTPNIVLAFHKYGTFDAPQMQNVEQDVAEWVDKSQEKLRKMAHLLNDIRNTVMEMDGGMLEVRGDHSLTLQYRKLEEDQMQQFEALGPALSERWAGVTVPE